MFFKKWSLFKRYFNNSGPLKKRTPSKKRHLSLEHLEGRELLSTTSVLFDFGTSTSPLATGYTRVPLINYSVSQGFGWDPNMKQGLREFDSGGLNNLTRDGHQGTKAAFLVDLPNGVYTVTAYLGGSLERTDNVSLKAENVQVGQNLKSAAGQVTPFSFQTEVKDGQLNLLFTDNGGLTRLFAVAGLEIRGEPSASNPPVAANDSYSVAEDNVLTVASPGVLSNDSDADGDPLQAVLVVGPSHGTLALNANGSFSYTPFANYFGADSFTYKAFDGTAYSPAATVNLTVFPVNDAPVANNDSFTLAEDGVLQLTAPGLFNNDSDVDGDALQAFLVTGPAHGTLTLNGNGSFTYTPQPNFNGSDSFTYKAGDGTAFSNLATVSLTVTPVNDAPAAAADSYTIQKNGLLTVATPGLLGNDSDVDGDVLTAVLVTGPGHGNLVLNTNGSFVYTPAVNYSGSDSFTYQAGDGKTTSNVATILLTVTNPYTPPVTDAGIDRTAPEGSAITFSGTVSGGESAYLFSWNFGDGSSGTGPSPTHTYADNGIYTATLTITDGRGSQSSDAITVTINNAQPVVTGLPANQNFSAGAPATVNLGSFTDPGIGDEPWTVIVNWGDTTANSTFTITAQGPLSRAHTFASVGIYTVTVTVKDKDNGSASASATVNVNEVSVSSGSATFFKLDTGTQGNWKGVYGSEGYSIIGDATSYPSYSQVSVPDGPWTWASSTSDVRALQKQTSSVDRIASTWYTKETGRMTFDINLTDGNTHTLALYAIDWDFGNRSQRVSVLDAATGNVLDVQNISNFTQGAYLAWNVSGHVQIEVSCLGGVNAVISGLFLGSQDGAIAANDSYSVQKDAVLTVATSGVLSNDWNPNSSQSIAILVSGPSHGTLTFNANGSFVYAPAAGFSGGDSFTYQVSDSQSLSNIATVSIAVQPGASGDFIETAHDKIPNFGANPTIISIHSGNWSDPNTWSLGRLPTTGDVVSIKSGFAVTYDVISNDALKTVAIQAGGSLIFRTDVSTRLTVVNLLVLEGGELQIGTETNPVAADVKAEVIFADVPLDLVNDPSQYGNGLIGLGQVTMHGAVKSDTFVRLAVEPKAGDRTLTLEEPVSGWRPGDRIVLPDTRHLLDSERWSKYNPQWEVITIQSISSDGRTLTLSQPLTYEHIGARDGNGVLEFLPHVGNLTRNVVVRSQNANGVRGHTMFTQRAEVDIRFSQFSGLGRTTKNALDNTTYDPNGQVTHVGTNQMGRYSIQFRHLMGPVSTPADGYQYTFQGNSVFCPIDPMPFKWGITILDSHFGLISDNVLYNWAGAGIVGETGNESFNVIERNFVVATRGDDNPRNNNGLDGSAFWFNGFNNFIRDNIAANAVGTHGGIVAGSGFNLFAPAAASANYRIPLHPGADLQIAGQYQLVDINLTPILEFARNETYGATATGLTLWHLGTDGYSTSDIAGSVIKDFRAWHVWEDGFFGYPIQNVTFDGFVVRGHPRAMNMFDYGTGWTSGDYWAGNVTLRNADIQGMYYGIAGSTNTPGTFRIEDSYFRNYKLNIGIQTLATPGATAFKPARQTIITNTRFDPWNGAPEFAAIAMVYGSWQWSTDLIQKDEVYVYDYNGVSGDNFRVYYLEQDPDFVVPQSGPGLIGSPEAGLTNQENWEKYGIAIAGAVAPSDASTLSEIRGLIVHI